MQIRGISVTWAQIVVWAAVLAIGAYASVLFFGAARDFPSVWRPPVERQNSGATSAKRRLLQYPLMLIKNLTKVSVCLGFYTLVLAALLRGLGAIAERTRSPAVADVLRRFADLVAWGSVPVIVGICVFWLRSSHKLVYAFVELLCGTLLIVDAMHDATLANFIATVSTKSLQIAGGLFVIVRGLDNLNKGLSEYPRAERVFQWFFRLNPDTKAGAASVTASNMPVHQEAGGEHGTAEKRLNGGLETRATGNGPGATTSGLSERSGAL